MFGKTALKQLVVCVCVGVLPLRAPGVQDRTGFEVLIVVRDAADAPVVRARLESLGGQVLAGVEDRIIWAAVTDRAEAEAMASPGVIVASTVRAADKLQTDSDPLVAAVAREFSRAIGQGRNVGAGADARNPLIDDAWSQGAVSLKDYLANLRGVGLDPSDAKVAPRLARPNADGALLGNSDNMTGTVAVALLLVESNGTIDQDLYTWTVADENYVIASTTSGLAWWAARASDHGETVSFAVYYTTHDDARVQQGYEPILHSSSYATQWVSAIMANFGFDVGSHLARVSAFNTWLRTTYNTDRAYTAFVCYNPPDAPTEFTDGYAAWAYLGGGAPKLL